MAREKLSEYRAKTILYERLGKKYGGLSVDASNLDTLLLDKYIKGKNTNYVVKVDQAVKKRNKSGLVFLDVPGSEVMMKVKELKGKGYRWLLIEPFIKHGLEDERFIALERRADGVLITHSSYGGVDVEENKDGAVSMVSQEPHGLEALDIDASDIRFIRTLLESFEQSHMSYLEINPYIHKAGKPVILDAASEVDSSSEFFVGNNWSSSDIRKPMARQSKEEAEVEKLASKSPSSLMLKVLNNNGSIFMLLSGGGASVVVADEFTNLGRHVEIANYGEYSGNPTEDETYLYSKQVINLMLHSKAKKKVLLIAGAVANFTDIASTFKGIVRAMKDMNKQIVSQNIHVVVRRGGPNQAKGLKYIKDYLEGSGISNEVYGPEVSLAHVVSLITKRLDK